MRIAKSNVHRGWFLIGLLIVLAIILILTYNQLAPTDKVNQINFAKTSLDKSRNTACEANRVTAMQNVTMWRINHPGEVPTVEILLRDGVSIPGCTTGGIYSIRPDGGEVYCSKHNPDPAATPTPVPTPAPIPPEKEYDPEAK